MEDLIKEFKTYASHYLVLGVILNIGVGAFWYFRYLRSAQLLTVGLTGLTYIVWGIIHHYIRKDLHGRVILEYFSTTILGFLVIFFLLFRA